jgi:hypothetical protein
MLYKVVTGLVDAVAYSYLVVLLGMLIVLVVLLGNFVVSLVVGHPWILAPLAALPLISLIRWRTAAQASHP